MGRDEEGAEKSSPRRARLGPPSSCLTDPVKANRFSRLWDRVALMQNVKDGLYDEGGEELPEEGIRALKKIQTDLVSRARGTNQDGTSESAVLQHIQTVVAIEEKALQTETNHHILAPDTKQPAKIGESSATSPGGGGTRRTDANQGRSVADLQGRLKTADAVKKQEEDQRFEDYAGLRTASKAGGSSAGSSGRSADGDHHYDPIAAHQRRFEKRKNTIASVAAARKLLNAKLRRGQVLTPVEIGELKKLSFNVAKIVEQAVVDREYVV